MIRYTQGDILKAQADALVNTVNCVGISGRGVALQFKKAFPDNFKAYENVCKKGDLSPGEVFVYERSALDRPRYIINFPTKRHWRGKSRVQDIRNGMDALRDAILRYEIESIAMPALGSGLGGLEWTTVKDIIEEKLYDMSTVDIFVYQPNGAPSTERVVKDKEAPGMTEGRAALIKLVNRYLGGFMDPEITLLEIHKLMYFMQEAGQPLRLNCSKGHYGPYAENLRFVLSKIDGYYTSGYGDGSDRPDKRIDLVPGADKEAEEFLAGNEEALERFEKVAQLVDGFESPFGMELLATVHWVVTRECADSIDEVISKTWAWNSRKSKFKREDVGLAYRVLSERGWLQPSSN